MKSQTNTELALGPSLHIIPSNYSHARSDFVTDLQWYVVDTDAAVAANTDTALASSTPDVPANRFMPRRAPKYYTESVSIHLTVTSTISTLLSSSVHNQHT